MAPSSVRALVDDSVLIAEVYKQCILWDSRLKDYRNARRQESAWKLIATTLNQDASQLQHRWNTLRSRYVKERRMARVKKAHFMWRLSQEMKFLEPIIKNRMSRTKMREANGLSPSQGENMVFKSEFEVDSADAVYSPVETPDRKDLRNRKSFQEYTYHDKDCSCHECSSPQSVEHVFDERGQVVNEYASPSSSRCNSPPLHGHTSAANFSAEEKVINTVKHNTVVEKARAFHFCQSLIPLHDSLSFNDQIDVELGILNIYKRYINGKKSTGVSTDP